MKKRQITIKDIAKSLNVAPSTVSRALADHPDISKETKELVLAYAKEHKYKPNALALSLRTSNTKTIGVILPQIVHYFFSSILSGIEDEAEKEGYRVIITQSNEIYEREVRGARTLQESRVCGVLASVAKTTTSFSHFQELVGSGGPLVYFRRSWTGILTDRVVVDDYAGVQSAVEYLIKTGCRRIAFYGSESHMPISRNRRMGYEDALRKNGIAIDKSLMSICNNYADAMQITPAMLSLPEPPDAFFAVNDETALGILNVVKSKGLKVPEDISICGFTNNSIAELSNPQLTSVDQHGYEMGATSMRLLLDHIEGRRENDQIVNKIIKTNLVVRETTR